MAIKFTYDYVKSFIEKEEYALLSDTYKNSKTKLLVKCPKGHEYKVAFNSFKQGNRCLICSGKQKFTYNDVKNYIEKEGYQLLSDTYKNCETKLIVRCSKGHEYKVTFDSFKRGSRCPNCSNKKYAEKRRHSYNYIKEQFEKECYELLSDTYVNNKTKLLVRCPKGHEYKVRFDSFNQGKRCPLCCDNNHNYTYDYVKEYMEKEGYKLLSDTYVNNKTKLLVRCPEGHEYKIRFYSFGQGNRCPVCNIKHKEHVEKRRHNYNFIKDQFEKEGYQLLSDTYVNMKTKLSVRCPEGHEYKVTFGRFQQGGRCPTCYALSKSSKGEKQVAMFVESLGYDIIRNDRTQIVNPLTGNNLELDILIPSLNKAIEYNGWYWHRFSNTDKIKKQECKNNGIDLLIVWDDKWTNNQSMEQQIIKNFIGEI